MEPVPDEGAWDYLHLNSIDLRPDGDLILSGRHTDTIYRVSRDSGQVLWRLGGADSDFAIPRRAVFRKQHDARWHDDGTLSVFDNATKDINDDAQPRGLAFRLDEDAHTVRIVRELAPPRTTNSSSQGNVEIDDDGRATVGWGSSNLVTAYDADDAVVFDASMPTGFSSYRAFRTAWTGTPLDLPLLGVTRAADDQTTVWVSWNGATEVASWELLAGDSVEALEPAGVFPREGFETAIAVPDRAAMVAVRALDVSGEPLGESDPITIEEALAVPPSVY